MGHSRHETHPDLCRLAPVGHRNPKCCSSTAHAYATCYISSQQRSSKPTTLHHVATSASCINLHTSGTATGLVTSAVRQGAGVKSTQLGAVPAGSTPGAAAAAAAVDLELWTEDGATHSMRVRPGSTTSGELRRMAAEKTGLPAAEVRLAYAGLELPLSSDGAVFNARPGVTKLFTMRRAAAAQDAQPSTDSAASSSGPGEGHAAAAAAAAAAAKEEPAPSSPPTEVTVQTQNGKLLKVPLTASTTAGDIRKAVAASMGASASEVRMAYAGVELDPSKDSSPFKVNPKITMLQCMMRMKGGLKHRSNMSNSTASTSMMAEPHSTIVKHLAASNASAGSWRLSAAARSASATSSSDTGSSRSLPSVTAPGSGKGCSAQVQLAKQFRHIMRHPIPGVSVAPDDGDEMTWHVKLAGPANSPYAGGWFSVQLKFDAGFPGHMPNVRFMTPIWHPNIAADGHWVCVDFGGDVRSVACVLSGLQMLLAHPNPDSPVNHGCARDMRQNPSAYVAKARSMTQVCAM